MTTGLERTGFERTGFERAQALRFTGATDPRTARLSLRGGTARGRRSLRAWFAVRRFPRRAVGHRPVTTAGAATPPVRRARDVHDSAIARGIAPPF